MKTGSERGVDRRQDEVCLRRVDAPAPRGTDGEDSGWAVGAHHMGGGSSYRDRRGTRSDITLSGPWGDNKLWMAILILTPDKNHALIIV